MNHKSGYAAIIGLPNSGKSTLLNTLLGQKLSIVTNKPQTTRKKILGILSDPEYQVIFLDTPGIIKPGYLLQEKMMEAVNSAVKDTDVILLIIDLAADPDAEKSLNNEIISRIKKSRRPLILLLNKIDLLEQNRIKTILIKLEASKQFNKIVPISASKGINIGEVLNSLILNLPEHPKYYPDDIIAEETERFFVSEIIREKIFEQYQEEIPYSTEVSVVEFKEREEKKNYISAEIIVEKESQKGIIIGKSGSAVKKLGEAARQSIEEFLQHPVFLELRVKVRNKWRSDEKSLKDFGYSQRKD
ncbi:MAG TPA: GTPase Era [Ignavibacteriaceae bacterium]|nr:GTPase Era [Ignavibacteriaceae bacterium]